MNIWRLKIHHDPNQYDQVLHWSETQRMIAIGWGDTGDLRNLAPREPQDIARHLAVVSPDRTTSSRSNAGNSLWRLYSEMRIDDLVILNSNHREKTMRVRGNYFFKDGEYPPYYEHRRKAEALPVDPNRLWHRSGGAAAGQSIYSTLVRCANGITEAELRELMG